MTTEEIPPLEYIVMQPGGRWSYESSGEASTAMVNGAIASLGEVWFERWFAGRRGVVVEFVPTALETGPDGDFRVSGFCQHKRLDHAE